MLEKVRCIKCDIIFLTVPEKENSNVCRGEEGYVCLYCIEDSL